MILVTGGSGFVGSALLKRFLNDGFEVKASSRSSLSVGLESVQYHPIHNLSASTDWTETLNGVQAIVHCAARVHVMQEEEKNPLQAYRDVNVTGTLTLARKAAESGVRRFVFVSSIKVNGEFTRPGQPFSADDAPSPLDPYGVSKLEAEQGLRAIEAQTGMEVVIVRPPIVYGPGVKANFATMMRCVARGIPLPLGAIHNIRSLVGIGNLVDLLVLCLTHPNASGQTFLVSDGEDVSTTELLRRTANVMGKKALLLPVPAFVLECGAALLGERAVAQRLCGSLQIDMDKTRHLLGWTPPLTLDQGLKKAVESVG